MPVAGPGAVVPALLPPPVPLRSPELLPPVLEGVGVDGLEEQPDTRAREVTSGRVGRSFMGSSELGAVGKRLKKEGGERFRHQGDEALSARHGVAADNIRGASGKEAPSVLLT